MVFSGGGACVGYDEIRSMSGRYASYWNAFLCLYILKWIGIDKIMQKVSAVFLWNYFHLP